ncbi:hypothetical protein EDB86DRAFT_3106132 [Lactarius hatsudake]|nr:hypothetical protein EDB86DRAFT_3106132 [Lactarius hatsudake]
MATSEKSRVAQKRAPLSAIACNHLTQQGLSPFDRDSTATITDLPTTPRAPQGPAHSLASLHTPEYHAS